MEALLPVLQKLHGVLGSIGDFQVTLPSIVVVGGQSSGKSSVLEAIVGRDFLPRGVGVVTRRPLELQLCNVSRLVPSELRDHERDGLAPSNDPNEWGEFAHKPGRKYFSFDEIRQEIARETERSAGKNKGVIQDPIGLRIYSPRVPDLTVVDLPGITRVPVGDQPADIEAQIREICLAYVRQPNTLILAVSPANSDITTSDAIKLALEVDPAGERTIGK